MNKKQMNNFSDQEISSLIYKERERQQEMIGLIPSENHCSDEVCAVLGAGPLTSKYSEGYPGARYYEGNQVIDEIENLAQERLKKLFGVPHVNVQPYSGSPANSAIEMALLENGDKLMGLQLSSGGHLTHGHPKVTFSGRFFESIQFGVDPKTARIDLDEVRALALKERPKLLMIGNTAYPFILDFQGFREIADEIDAWLVADISHITGLVVAGEHPSPVAYADVVMSTTHKTFRGPRGAMILVTQRGMKKDPDLGKKIDKAVFPGLQGGPHNATTAAIAVAAAEAMRPEYQEYGRQIRKNATALAAGLMKRGVKLVGDGTQTHLMIIDLSEKGKGLGTQVAWAMDVAGIYANKNTVPTEQGSPMWPSGVRLGTPLVTTRGMKEEQMDQIADWVARAIAVAEKEGQLPADLKARRAFIADYKERMLTNQELLAIRAEVKAVTAKYPLFTW
jgi:glycine hydroxymethyltransferase